MHHNLLVGWQYVEYVSIMPADRSGLYPVLQSWQDEYDCPCFYFFQSLLFSLIIVVCSCVVAQTIYVV